MLVDRGYIKYEDKISKFWPEFAQNGKSEITFGWIMSHKVIFSLRVREKFRMYEIFFPIWHYTSLCPNLLKIMDVYRMNHIYFIFMYCQDIWKLLMIFI